MTEQEWQECADPHAMLAVSKWKVTDKRRRLFIVTCCRRVWHLLSDPRSRQAVEILERHLESGATQQELQDGWGLAGLALTDVRKTANHSHHHAANVAAQAMLCTAAHNTGAAQAIAKNVVAAMSTRMDSQGQPVIDPDVEAKERMALANDLRCTLGTPFRKVTIEDSWCSSNVTALAQAIYDDRAFDRMPILADALEDAGCSNQDILQHCRSGGEHVRGCWVVDLLLGKA